MFHDTHYLFCRPSSLLLLLCLYTVSVGHLLPVAQAELVNARVERKINVSNHIVRQSIAVRVENPGPRPEPAYLLAIPAEREAKLAHIVVDEPHMNLTLTRDVTSRPGSVVYRLPIEIESKGSANFKVQLVYKGLLIPHPKTIIQNENQLVKYTDSHHFYSPYTTQSQETEVILGTTVVESRSTFPPVSSNGESLTYGPYTDVPAWSTPSDALYVHYECNTAFITMDEVTRRITVSHSSWFYPGLHIEDDYSLRHSGAVLKGPFSRFEYQRNAKAFGASAFQNLRTELPVDALDFYYQDALGNISTAMPLASNDSLTIELSTRFPIFGGWKNHFQVGYYLPLSRLSSDFYYHILELPVTVPIKGEE